MHRAVSLVVCFARCCDSAGPNRYGLRSAMLASAAARPELFPDGAGLAFDFDDIARLAGVLGPVFGVLARGTGPIFDDGALSVPLR